MSYHFTFVLPGDLRRAIVPHSLGLTQQADMLIEWRGSVRSGNKCRARTPELPPLPMILVLTLSVRQWSPRGPGCKINGCHYAGRPGDCFAFGGIKGSVAKRGQTRTWVKSRMTMTFRVSRTAPWRVHDKLPDSTELSVSDLIIALSRLVNQCEWCCC